MNHKLHMSLSDGSAVLQQLCTDYPSYSPSGTTVHRHVTCIFFWFHYGAHWCHLANTMDNLRTAVVKQLNCQKVMQTPLAVDSWNPRNHVSLKRAQWRHLANTIAYITWGPDVVMEKCKPNNEVTAQHQMPVRLNIPMEVIWDPILDNYLYVNQYNSHSL